MNFTKASYCSDNFCWRMRSYSSRTGSVRSWHIFSQIIVICFNVKTGRSAFFKMAEPLFFGGELGSPAIIGDVARCCSEFDELPSIGSGDPGEAGGEGLVAI